MSVAKMLRMVEEARAGTADNLRNLAVRGLPSTPMGAFARFRSTAISGINRGIKELGSHAAGWGKPLLYGLAGTAAVSMLMGGVKTQPMTPPVMARSSERDMRPESLPVPGGVQGRPTPPGLPAPTTYMTNSPQLSYRVVARGRADSLPDNESITNALRPIVGNRSMRISIRDDRSKLTSQNISDMMERF
jgi:hypothetical protein